eukprot:4445060-Lingulodinium_polyedra.AAC.1
MFEDPALAAWASVVGRRRQHARRGANRVARMDRTKKVPLDRVGAARPNPRPKVPGRSRCATSSTPFVT